LHEASSRHPRELPPSLTYLRNQPRWGAEEVTPLRSALVRPSLFVPVLLWSVMAAILQRCVGNLWVQPTCL